MLVLRPVLASLASIAVLFLLTKLMGNRQMSHLSMFDYISGITIGSIAAEMAIGWGRDITAPLTAMTVYAVVTAAAAVLTNKSLPARRALTGRAYLLLDGGRLIRENFRRARLDINEFLTQCRIAGYFDLAELQCAVMEPNGDISFLPKASLRPVTPADMALPVPAASPSVTLIADGAVLTRNLAFVNRTELWLAGELKKAGADSPASVFYAALNGDGELEVYVKLAARMDTDIFG